MADADPKKAIVYAVNSGRDTDCRAHTAGSLSGALRGISAVPQNWIKTVDEAMAVNPYTVSKRSCKETAEGIYRAAMNNTAKMQGVIDLVNSMT